MSLFDSLLGPPPTMLGPGGVSGMAGAPALGTPRAKPVAATPSMPKPPEPTQAPGPFDDLLTMPVASTPTTPKAPTMTSPTPPAARKAMTQQALQKAAGGMFP